jgi:hypothetical protein
MTLKSLAVSAALLSVTIAPAMAASLRGCDSYETNAAFLAFPAAENTAEYSDGRVRLITLDTAGEPACCSFHLMVLYPSADGSFSECALISSGTDMGYYSIFVAQATVVRDDDTGLSLVVPTEGSVEGAAVADEIQFDVDLVAGTLSVR